MHALDTFGVHAARRDFEAHLTGILATKAANANLTENGYSRCLFRKFEAVRAVVKILRTIVWPPCRPYHRFCAA